MSPFDLDKALAGHTVYFRGKPVDEWCYFPQSKKLAAIINNVPTWFDGSHFQSSGLELGPRIAWAIYNRLVDRLGAFILYPTREEALSLCSQDETPVQVIIEV